jgi:hypothetical protein
MFEPSEVSVLPFATGPGVPLAFEPPRVDVVWEGDVFEVLDDEPHAATSNGSVMIVARTAQRLCIEELLAWADPRERPGRCWLRATMASWNSL